MDFELDPERDLLKDPRGKFRGVRVPKPRVPWGRGARNRGVTRVSCGNKTRSWPGDPGAQVLANWFAKNCGPSKTAREFHDGGPESGTLAGARRAEGLFDYGWGTDFPLARAEQKALQEGRPVVDPLWAPPTDAPPGNWIADKQELLRRRFQKTEYSTASDINKLCGPGGSGITCEGPNGGVSWSSDGGQLTAADQARFRAAYCGPGDCIKPGQTSPPPGFTERVIIGKPRNPAVALRAGCRVVEPAPLVTTQPLPSAPPATPAPQDWSCSATELGCVGMNCVVHGQDRTMHWKAATPPAVLAAWWQANCSASAM